MRHSKTGKKRPFPAKEIMQAAVQEFGPGKQVFHTIFS
jgi:hypothetical protein